MPPPAYASPKLSQSLKDSLLRCFQTIVRVKQQRITLGSPGVTLTDSPNCDTDVVLLAQACLDDVYLVGLLRIMNVEFSQRTLRSGTAQRLHSCWGVCVLFKHQETLGANTSIGMPCEIHFLTFWTMACVLA